MVVDGFVSPGGLRSLRGQRVGAASLDASARPGVCSPARTVVARTGARSAWAGQLICPQSRVGPGWSERPWQQAERKGQEPRDRQGCRARGMAAGGEGREWRVGCGGTGLAPSGDVVDPCVSESMGTTLRGDSSVTRDRRAKRRQRDRDAPDPSCGKGERPAGGGPAGRLVWWRAGRRRARRRSSAYEW